MDRPKLSMIVPCYNEEKNVEAFQEAVIQAFAGCGYDYEIVFVDDGSYDHTLDVLREIHKEQKCPVKVISLSRNFGKEAAIYAGLDYASGQYLNLIDADLQQRPEYVRGMVDILDRRPDVDMVAAFQLHRKEGKILSFFKKSFYSLINKMSDVKFRPDASDFRTFRWNVGLGIWDMKECHRFSKGLFSWVGFKTVYMPYEVCERAAGTTKWSFRKLFNYALEGIIGFSTKPLRLAAYLGLLSSIAAFLYAVVVLFEKLVWKTAVPGYATIAILILLLGGLQLLCLGIIGEYVGKIFEQSKRRPIYLAKKIWDIPGPEPIRCSKIEP